MEAQSLKQPLGNTTELLDRAHTQKREKEISITENLKDLASEKGEKNSFLIPYIPQISLTKTLKTCPKTKVIIKYEKI